MAKFLKDEILICILNSRASDSLTIGKEYKALSDSNNYYLSIIDDDDSECEYHPERFISLSEYRKITINSIINPNN